MNVSGKLLSLFLLLFCVQTASAEWIKQNVNTLAWLRDIYFFNENHGIIAGSGGTFLETKDGGKNWSKRKKFTSDTILQIYFSDEYKGWLLCERDPFNRGENSSAYLLKTTDGGETWDKIEFKDGSRARVTRIFFNQKGKGFAIGESGAFFEQTDEETWQKSPSPIRYLLLDGAFFDDSHGAIIGAGGNVYFSEDAGVSWTPANVFGKPATKLNSIFFTNSKNGWIAGANGKIFQTINGGKMWREQNSRVAADLFDVYFKNTAEGWAVGADGIVLHTTTGGNIWNIEETSVKHKLEKVLYVGGKAFAVGFGGTILVYQESIKNRSAVKIVLQNELRKNYRANLTHEGEFS